MKHRKQDVSRAELYASRTVFRPVAFKRCTTGAARMLTDSRCSEEKLVVTWTNPRTVSMSVSLVRRGLELFNDEVKDVSKVKQQQKKKKKKRKTPSSATVMELVSTKRQGVTRQVKRLQGRLGPGKSKATVKDKRIESAVEEFRKKQRKSQMSTNLKYFMDNDYKTPDSETLKIMSHHPGRQSRNRPEHPARKTKETESLFTEKEFQQFQKEYFGRTVEERK